MGDSSPPFFTRKNSGVNFFRKYYFYANIIFSYFAFIINFYSIPVKWGWA